MHDYALSLGQHPHRRGKLNQTSHAASRLVTAHFVAVTEEEGYMWHNPKFKEYTQWSSLGYAAVRHATHSSTAPLLPHSLSLFFDDCGLVDGLQLNRCVEKLVGGPGKAYHQWVGDFLLLRDEAPDRYCDVTKEDLAPVIAFFRDYARPAEDVTTLTPLTTLTISVG